MIGKLEKSIKNCARLLEGFLIDGQPVGYDYALKSLSGWAENFTSNLIDEEILAKLIDGFEFISDDSIRRNTLEFVEKNLPADEVYYTSFGEENESSARIVASLNTKENYSRDIFSLLEKIDNQKIVNPKIVFIDDFLNSGGQFASIINSWFTKRISSRRTIDKKLLNLLKKCELYFIFAYGMEKGRVRAEDELQQLKLNGKVHIITQYADNFGIFGSERNIYNIANRIETASEPETLFKNYSCDQIRNLYDICETAGRQLYSLYKPDHDEDKIEHRKLGYSNSAKLFFGQNNIPTCSLTCLWLGGEVHYHGRKTNWQPLFKRKEKAVGGSEGSKIQMPLAETLSHSYLDLTEGRESGLEINLSDCLQNTITKFPADRWIDCSDNSLEFFNPLIRDFLEINKSSFFQKLKPEFYQKINQHLKFYFKSESEPFDVKISDISIISLGNLKSFMQIGFQFTASKINLKTALEINSVLALKQNRRGSSFLRLKTGKDNFIDFSVYQLFEMLSSNLDKENKLDYTDFLDVANCKKVERYIQFSYLRENGDYFRSGVRQLNEFIKIASDFSLPNDDNLKIPDSFKNIELALEANISCSRKGMVFTGSSISKNSSIKQHFFYRYGLCYYLVWHLDQLIMEYRLTHFDNSERSCQIKNWLTRFALFPFEKISELEYLNQYLAKLSSYFKIADNLETIRSFKSAE